jgi:UDP-N-acetylmuramate dehydrogenase
MELINNASLRHFTTFGVDAHCDHLYRVEDAEELRLAMQYLEHPLILGGGSNILPIGDIHRNVLRIELKGIEIMDDREDVLVRVAAGEVWHEVVMWAIDRNLGGIENLSLIPGTMGAAPMQNIGAYGVELESVFDHLTAMEIGTGQEHTFSKADCAFGYRDSVFKQAARDRFVITDVVLRLSREHKVNTSYGAIHDVLQQRNIAEPTIRDVSDAVIAIRRSKLPDPAVIGNAGSFFKNPVISETQYNSLKVEFPEVPGYPSGTGWIKVPAGWLIEQAGWKGKRLGNVGCYEKQALVLVNHGGATGNEVWSLAQGIIKSVKQLFGIALHPEVNLWGV